MVRHLLRDGWRVRALTRNPSSSSSRFLAAQGAEIHQVDAEDPRSLRPAFQGVHGVYNVQNPMTSSIAAEIRQGRNVAEAAAEANVTHVVYGAAGIGEEMTGIGSWDSKLTVAARFRDLGLPLTVLRPMAFMELMTDKRYYPAVGAWHMMPKLMGGTRPVGWLCVDDVGAIAARMFADPGRWANTAHSLVADVASVDACREIWTEARGRRPRGFPMPVWLFERFVGTDLTTMWRWLRTAEFELSTEPTRAILPEALTVRDWLTRQG